MSRIYRNVVHDGQHFEMERQIFLLAKAGADVWKKWMEQEPALKLPDDPMLPAMRELYQQLDKTDIFMGGFHTSVSEDGK